MWKTAGTIKLDLVSPAASIRCLQPPSEPGLSWGRGTYWPLVGTDHGTTQRE